MKGGKILKLGKGVKSSWSIHPIVKEKGRNPVPEARCKSGAALSNEIHRLISKKTKKIKGAGGGSALE